MTLRKQIVPTHVETFFDKDDIIVSKTDLKGRITYANQTFCAIAGYTEREVVGQPHSLIRHPDMPRAVFKLLWEALGEGRELFAYVKNMAKSGDHYWVFAHVTPSRDAAGQIVGYHSNRRVPDRRILEGTIGPLYAELLREENSHRNGKEALGASWRALTAFVQSRDMAYDQLVFSL
jgi:PAS domain S-box-containing protein